MKQKPSKPLVLCGPNGSPYRKNLEPESLTAFACAFSAKAAVGSHPPTQDKQKTEKSGRLLLVVNSKEKCFTFFWFLSQTLFFLEFLN